jgi:hypothetical protein
MKMKSPIYQILLFLLLFSFLNNSLYSQVGGSSTYDFLDLTNSARVAALGGKNISLNDNDLNLPFHNPALLTPEMDQNLVLNYVSYFAGVNYGYASYAFDKAKTGTFALGMHYIDYGNFIRASEDGTILGNFYANEYALNIFYSKPLDSTLRIGVTLKPIYSSLDSYNSFGIASDFGITYTGDQGLFTAAAVIRNVGIQLKSYTGNYREPIPFEILLGITKKLEYAPFRISITAHNLQKYQMTYDLPDQTNSTTDVSTNSQSKVSKFADNFFRHIIGGVEFLPTKSFYVSLGYNYQRRMELALKDSPGMAGFSYGFGLNLKRFRISYGRATYHAAGGSNHFSFSINLSQFYSR